MTTSCNQFKNDEQKVVASVYNTKLYATNLIGIVPKNASDIDSANIVRDYINQWARKQVILHKALNNDFSNPEEDAQLESQVTDYKNTLLIYRYKKHLVEQRLDTIVDYNEVEDYYNKHKNEFTLKEDIVQVNFVKFYKNSKNIKLVRKLFKDNNPEDIIKIKSIAEEKAVNYFIDDETWILYSDLIKEVPLEAYNKRLFFKNNKYIELEDSLYTYLLRINNYRIEDNISPFSFEYDNIRSLIINIRKIKLIENMENDVFKEAQKNGEINIK